MPTPDSGDAYFIGGADPQDPTRGVVHVYIPDRGAYRFLPDTTYTLDAGTGLVEFYRINRRFACYATEVGGGAFDNERHEIVTLGKTDCPPPPNYAVGKAFRVDCTETFFWYTDRHAVQRIGAHDCWALAVTNRHLAWVMGGEYEGAGYLTVSVPAGGAVPVEATTGNRAGNFVSERVDGGDVTFYAVNLKVACFTMSDSSSAAVDLAAGAIVPSSSDCPPAPS